MAWTNITNAQLAIGAPVRSIDHLALRDNIIAQANGDAGAPKQQTAGIEDNAVTAVKINKGNGLGASGSALVINCPTWGSVGSYAIGTPFSGGNPTNINVGSDYSAATAGIAGASGTWKCMGYTGNDYGYVGPSQDNPGGVFVTATRYLMCRIA